MQRRAQDTPERSAKDTFCTARHKDYEPLCHLMRLVSQELQKAGFNVWRQKIEAVVYDERIRKAEVQMGGSQGFPGGDRVMEMGTGIGYGRNDPEMKVILDPLGHRIPASEVYNSPLKGKIQQALQEARALKENIRIKREAAAAKDLEDNIQACLEYIPELIQNNKMLTEVAVINPRTKEKFPTDERNPRGQFVNIERIKQINFRLREALRELGLEPVVVNELNSDRPSSDFTSYIGIKLT